MRLKSSVFALGIQVMTGVLAVHAQAQRPRVPDPFRMGHAHSSAQLAARSKTQSYHELPIFRALQTERTSLLFWAPAADAHRYTHSAPLQVDQLVAWARGTELEAEVAMRLQRGEIPLVIQEHPAIESWAHQLIRSALAAYSKDLGAARLAVRLTSKPGEIAVDVNFRDPANWSAERIGEALESLGLQQEFHLLDQMKTYVGSADRVMDLAQQRLYRD